VYKYKKDDELFLTDNIEKCNLINKSNAGDTGLIVCYLLKNEILLLEENIVITLLINKIYQKKQRKLELLPIKAFPRILSDEVLNKRKTPCFESYVDNSANTHKEIRKE